MKGSIQLQRHTAADFTANNPILLNGQLGYEWDTGKFKIGNGITHWNVLPYHGDRPGIPFIGQDLTINNIYYKISDQYSDPVTSADIIANWTLIEVIGKNFVIESSLAGAILDIAFPAKLGYGFIWANGFMYETWDLFDTNFEVFQAIPKDLDGQDYYAIEADIVAEGKIDLPVKFKLI